MSLADSTQNLMESIKEEYLKRGRSLYKELHAAGLLHLALRFYTFKEEGAAPPPITSDKIFQ